MFKMDQPELTMKLFKRFTLAVVLSLAAISTLLAPMAAKAVSLTDTLEGLLIGHLFRGVPYTAPTTLFIGLLTSPCTDSAPGTEATGGAYARASVVSGAASWAAPVGGNGTTSNVNAIPFPTPTVSWGTVTHFGIYDAASAGNLLICQALTVSKVINIGDAVSFPAASLTVQIDN